MQQQAVMIEAMERYVITLSIPASEEPVHPEFPLPLSSTAKEVKCPVSPHTLLSLFLLTQGSWHFHSGGDSDSSK